MHQQKLSQSAN